MARLMMRRSTYPLPSLDGSTPSQIKNADALEWSAITFMATSTRFDSLSFFPESSPTFSIIGIKRSVS